MSGQRETRGEKKSRAFPPLQVWGLSNQQVAACKYRKSREGWCPGASEESAPRRKEWSTGPSTAGGLIRGD